MIYALSAIVCAIKRFRKPYHKHILLGGMIGAGAVIYAVLGRDGGVFLMFPMFAAGLYYSESICKKTYYHLIVLVVIDVISFFYMDINQLHYYGLEWDYSILILNYIFPECLFITVVFVFSLLAMKNGRKLIGVLVSEAEESAKKRAELETCTKVQKSALPKDFNIVPGEEFSISAGLQPAFEAAGDFYDFFMTDSGKLVALIADVSDKGLGSALYMMAARNTIRSLFGFTDDLEEIILRTNNILCDTSGMEFVTLFLVCLGPETGRGRYINAGHFPPLLVHPDGDSETVETEPQYFMGAFKDTKYASSDISVGRGDILCLYTDGITESVNSSMEEYSLQRIASVISCRTSSTTEDITKAVLDDVDAYSDSSLFADDRTILVLKRKAY